MKILKPQREKRSRKAARIRRKTARANNRRM